MALKSFRLTLEYEVQVNEINPRFVGDGVEMQRELQLKLLTHPSELLAYIKSQIPTSIADHAREALEKCLDSDAEKGSEIIETLREKLSESNRTFFEDNEYDDFLLELFDEALTFSLQSCDITEL